MVSEWEKIHTFAAVDLKMKRHIASWVLLAVFVPMVVLASVHIHPQESAGELLCNDCVQHQCHGHVGSQSASIHDCVLCQFLSLPMLAVAVATIFIFNKVCKNEPLSSQCIICMARYGTVGLRAPPFPTL